MVMAEPLTAAVLLLLILLLAVVVMLPVVVTIAVVLLFLVILSVFMISFMWVFLPRFFTVSIDVMSRDLLKYN